MTKILKNALLAIVGMSLNLVATTNAAELAPIGNLPKLETEWQIIDNGPSEELLATLPYRWGVFQNKRTGDFLSFATHPDPLQNRSLESLSDTSLEIFPKGRAVWSQPPAKSTTVNLTNHVIAIHVVDKGRRSASLKGENVLEYCFISDVSDGDNLMAHGRAWVGSKGAVFVQHTSAKPITSDMVDDVIKSIIKSQLTRASQPNQ